MKKYLYLLTTILLYAGPAVGQMRYLNEVFSTFQYSKDSVYATNYQVLTGSPVLVSLTCDIYQPSATDTIRKRPLIVLLHTGSFLPIFLNQLPTGDKNDSATKEIARGFARRGYVVCVPSYRLGWNPNATKPEDRAFSFVQALYRGVQDAKAAVRYMKKNASLYKIDTNRVVLGGQGTGAIIALTYAYVHNSAEMNSLATLPLTIDSNELGDLDNLTNGTYSKSNNPGYGAGINMVFSLGGAMSDISRIDKNEVPVVGMNSITDPWAYDTVLYNPPYPLIPLSGNLKVCRMAELQNLQVWKSCHFFDPYSNISNLNNFGISGLYYFVVPYPASFKEQSAPWEWWDSATVVQSAYQKFLPIEPFDSTALRMAKTCHSNALLTNQFMSKTKAIKYIDTIQNFLNPRIMYALQLPGYMLLCFDGGITNSGSMDDNNITIFPNPASDKLMITSKSELTDISMIDLTGREIYHLNPNNTQAVELTTSNLNSGIYLLRIQCENRLFIQKVQIR